MAEFIKLSITPEFKHKAQHTKFSKLDKPYPNPTMNVNETKSYLPVYQQVCALFYYETGIMLSYHNEFYGYYA
jgi:hypothetical protein